MNWGFFVFAIVLAGLGAICLYHQRRKDREITLMKRTQTSRAADVARSAPGTLVEVKGTIRCAAPLTAQFSGLSCVYSRSRIDREETRWKDGESETRSINESDVETAVVFEVEDASGRVRVDSTGASTEAPLVHDQSGDPPGGASPTGSLIAIAASLAGGPSKRYVYRENILAPDTPVYVLGTVQSGGAIGAAPAGARVHDFIITHETEAERVSSSRTTMIILLVLEVVLFGGALACLYASFKYA